MPTYLPTGIGTQWQKDLSIQRLLVQINVYWGKPIGLHRECLLVIRLSAKTDYTGYVGSISIRTPFVNDSNYSDLLEKGGSIGSRLLEFRLKPLLCIKILYLIRILIDIELFSSRLR